MIMTIVGVIIAIIVSIIAIYAFTTILEVFRFVASAGIMIFSLLWLSVFIKQKFELDKNVSIIIAGIISVLIGIAIYQSWWAIAVLATILIIAYAIWKYIGGEDLITALKKNLKK